MDETFSSLEVLFKGFTNNDNESEGTSLMVICNKARFHIAINPKDLRSTAKSGFQGTESPLQMQCQQLLDRLEADEDLDDHALYSEAESNLVDWAIHACMPLLGKLTAEIPITQYRTLEEYINPPAYNLKLVNNDGRLGAERCPDNPALTAEMNMIDKVQSSELHSSDLPRIKASSIELISIYLGGYYDISAEKVKVTGGSEYFYKRFNSREFKTLQDIKNAALPENLRIPRVEGLVEARDGSIVGMLLNLIDIRHDLNTAKALNTETTFADRKKWLEQIEYIVNQLHSVRICWGDVHPGNVVIDNNGDAWVVDFGGGYTKGYVSHKNYEKAAGDLEGIRNLAKHMGIEEA